MSFTREILLAGAASVSVRLRNKERGKRIKDRGKFFFHCFFSCLFFGSHSIFRAVKPKIPRSFFTPKPN